MPRSCLNCGHCQVKTELRPLKRGSRRFKHPNPIAQDKLNSRLIYGRVRCVRGMWAKRDGSEFIYKNFNMMMQNVDTNGLKGHLTMADKCLRYDHG